MSKPPSLRAQLERQLEELGAIRNAGTRSEEFRSWRQHTLTVLQRAWPDDPRQAERFKRVPFTPPSERADAQTIRLCFEKGCGEAGALLRELIVAQTPSANPSGRGRKHHGHAPAPAPEPPGPPVLPPALRNRGPHPTARPPGNERNEPPANEPPPMSAESLAEAISDAHEDEEARRTTEQFLQFSPVFRAGIGKQGTERTEPVERTDRHERTERTSGAERDRDPGRRDDDEYDDRAGEGGGDEHAEERRRETHPKASAPVALALVTLARDRELEACGVLVIHRAEVRALMLELASAIEAGSPRWPVLRDAMRTAIEFPRLAARLLPLLVCYVGEAAADASRRAA
jgi:hypothetical protein